MPNLCLPIALYVFYVDTVKEFENSISAHCRLPKKLKARWLLNAWNEKQCQPEYKTGIFRENTSKNDIQYILC